MQIQEQALPHNPGGISEAHVTRLEARYAIPHEKIYWLAKNGIIKSVDEKEIRSLFHYQKDDHSIPATAILIRYPNADDMFVIRYDTPRRRPDGKEQRYDRPAGLPPRLFIPPGLDLLQKAKEIWITEGELKSLCGWAHGLPVCALPGVYNWRQNIDESDPEMAAAKLAGPGGKAPDPEALIDDLRWDWTGKRIALIYDSDITQKHPAWPAFGRLAEQLYALGAAEVKIVTLPAVEPERGEDEDSRKKTGLDDYIRRRTAGGYDAVAELREIVRRAPVWVPSAGYLFNCVEKVGTLKGLENFAMSHLASDDPEKRILGAAAYNIAQRETMLQAALNRLGIRGEAASALKHDAKAEAERIKERQKQIYHAETEKTIQTISSIWPDAPHGETDFSCPDDYHWAPDALEKEEVGFIDGEMVIEYIPLCAPVFVSKILDCVDDDEHRYELTFFHSSGKKWVSESVKPAALVDKKKFAAEILNRGLLTYSAKKVDDILEYFAKFIEVNKTKIPVSRYTIIAGRRNDFNIIVYPNGTWGKDGMLKNSPVMYFDDHTTPDFLLEIAPLPDGSEKEARQIISTLLKCAEPATAWTIAGWFAAALLARLVRQTWNEFPILNLHGGRGSGKSSLLQTMSIVFFAFGSLGSARRPPFSLLREMSCSNMFPVILDEYRLYEIRDDHRDTLHHLLRHGYHGGRETRGRPDQTTVDYYLLAPVVIAGESRIEDAAIRERCIILPVNRATICDYPGAKDAYSSLLGQEQALRRTAGWLWSQSLQVEADEVIGTLREIEANLRKKLCADLPDRPRHNLAIVLFGCMWLNAVLKLDFDKAVFRAIIEKFKQAAKEEDTQVDYFIRFLELENSLPTAKRTIPMRRDGEELVVHQTAAIENYAAYARKNHLLFLGRDALKKELKEEGVEVDKLRRFSGKLERCLVINAKKIEEKYSIPIDSWNKPWPPKEKGEVEEEQEQYDPDFTPKF